MVEMARVDSKNIEQIGYDADKRELHVLFRAADTAYVYDDVPQAAFDALMGADSHGKHFRANIWGRYPHRKLETPSE